MDKILGILFPSQPRSKRHSLAVYSSLSTKDDKLSDPDPDTASNLPHRSFSRWQHGRAAIITVSIVVFGLLSVSFLRLQEDESARAILHCGSNSTTAEAESLGCKFDILSYSWTPEPCFDEATATEFHEWLEKPERQMGGFPFFYDVNGTHRVSDENALAESFGSTIYTTQEEHLGHCTFMMRRLYRVAESKGRLQLNSRYGTLEHTKHCSEEVLVSFKRPDPREMGGIHAMFGVSFESC